MIAPAQPNPDAFRMSADQPKLRTDLRVAFADGEYRFALAPVQMIELEKVCGYVDRDGTQRSIGIGAIFGRLARGRAFLPGGAIDWANVGVGELLASEVTQRDCIAVIRLGLIGGGEGVVLGEAVKVDASRARDLIETYVVNQPIEQAWGLAFAILGARLCGRSPMESEA